MKITKENNKELIHEELSICKKTTLISSKAENLMG